MASLAERIQKAPGRRRPNRGCETCLWWSTLPEVDQDAILEWIKSGWSIRQLHGLCTSDPDHPLPISVTAFKNHLRTCVGLID